jgi:hypothetical protein
LDQTVRFCEVEVYLQPAKTPATGTMTVTVPDAVEVPEMVTPALAQTAVVVVDEVTVKAPFRLPEVMVEP